MNELEIENGVMGIPFDPLVSYYTVRVEEDVDELIFHYEVNEGWEVNIVNNVLSDGINFVYLEVKKDGNMETYTLEVYRESVKAVIREDDAAVPMMAKKEVDPGVYYLLFLICFLLIILTYKLVYKKPKWYKKSKK